MELGKQIKKYRKELSLSQDALAEKIFVSRQTISNWENDKSYPDINSLLLLSEVFNTSIDNLIKGDVEIMKKEISQFEREKFKKLSSIFGFLLFLQIITPMPLIYFFGNLGIAILIVISVISICFSLSVEKQKKKYDIQTFKEINAFMEGKSLDEIEKAREEGKRIYQKVILAILSASLTIAIAIGFICFIR